MSKINNYRNYREVFTEDLKNNPEKIRIYLEVSLEEYEKDNDSSALLLALKTVIKAQDGGISAMAKKINFTREGLSKALSGKRNPKLETITSIIHALGYRISLKPV